MDRLVEIDCLTKRFGPVTAVDGVSFSVARGEVVALLGPNGAGKSTAMKLLAGYLEPTSGTARVCGFDVSASPIEARRRIGYLPEGAPLYDDMTPARLLDFVGRIRGLDGGARRRAAAEAAGRLRLESVLDRPIGALSKGFRRRVGLAQALLADPDVLILDEPTDGLDPNQKREVRALLREAGQRKAALVSTHALEEVEAVCARAVVIAAGRIVADATPAELAARWARRNAVVVRAPRADAARTLEAALGAAGAVSAEASDAGGGEAEIRVLAAPGADIREPLRRALAEAGLEPLELHREPGRLEDAFAGMTGGHAEPAAAGGAR